MRKEFKEYAFHHPEKGDLPLDLLKRKRLSHQTILDAGFLRAEIADTTLPKPNLKISK